jgi:hypothetical protein
MAILFVFGFAAFSIPATILAYALAREWGMRRAIASGRKENRQ